MSLPHFRITRLAADHDRSAFRCGAGALDGYFQRQVTQDIRRRIASCFVALSGDDRVAGFYTLSAAGLPLTDLPKDLGQRLPRYPSIPAARMGRLAVDQNFRGIGLGGALLADALERAIRSDLTAYAMVVDAKDETAAAFYRHHGFIAFPDSAWTLFLPLATLR